MMDVMRKLVLSALKSSHVLARTQGSRNMMAVRLMSATKQVNMKFEEAADCVQTLKNEPGNDVKLKMYALFKQATIGANTTKKPGAFNFVGQAKWTAWKDLETISQEEAKAMYVKIVRDLMEAEGESVGHAEDVVAASEFKHIVVTEQDNFTKILLNRPNKKNALTVDMYEELIVALNSAGKSDKSALTVITGAGDYFCSGNDLGNFMSITPDKMHAVAKESGDLLRRYVAAYIDHPKPLVAAINGPAIGVAVTVLGLCDVVYAADHATFTTPFSQLGQSPEGCSSYTFPKIMGHSKACELMLFNVKLNASEALNCGLVTRVFPKHEFQTRVETALKQMSALPVKSLVYSKALMRSEEREVLHRVNVEECERLVERWTSEDCINAVMNFFQSKSS